MSIDDVINEYYKEPEKLTKNNLEEIVGQELQEAMQKLFGQLGVLNEDIAPSAGGYFLPTIKITEDWGRVGSKDRQIIEGFTSNVAGNTLEEKIDSINNIITGADTEADIPKILGAMMVVEILNAILNEFTESAGGFIFEGFLAGLFGGQAVQITDVGEEEGDASGKPITDVRMAGKEYSLKLLGASTVVKGSFKNLIEHFRGKDHIIYLDARRIEDGLEFSEFIITLDNFLEVFFKPFAKLEKKTFQAPTVRVLKNRMGSLGEKIFKIKASKRINGRSILSMEEISQLDDATLKQAAPFTISYSEESFAKSKKAVKLFGTGRQFNNVAEAIESGDRDAILGALTQTAGYSGREQFLFTKEQVKKTPNFREIGRLEISAEVLKRTWLAYGDVLRANVEPIYKALNSFTTNINAFLLDSPDEEADRKQHGQAASIDARHLKRGTEKAVREIGRADSLPAAE